MKYKQGDYIRFKCTDCDYFHGTIVLMDYSEDVLTLHWTKWTGDEEKTYTYSVGEFINWDVNGDVSYDIKKMRSMKLDQLLTK
jgi:hypothetical protein